MSFTFWVFGPLSVLAAFGLILGKKAVHCALMLAGVMMCLAILYASQDAPFLFAVQIVVYTGAVLMLFLFVLMLVGVDSSDSLVETIRGQRWLAILGALLFGILLLVGVSQVTLLTPVGLDGAQPNGNVPAIAQLLFSKYVFAFEITSALLITAAVGAMILAHRERLGKKVTQKDYIEQRMKEYAEDGKHPGQATPPGVFARHNAVDTPALLPDGTPAPGSVSRVLVARGNVRAPEQYSKDINVVERDIAGDSGDANGSSSSRGGEST